MLDGDGKGRINTEALLCSPPLKKLIGGLSNYPNGVDPAMNSPQELGAELRFLPEQPLRFIECKLCLRVGYLFDHFKLSVDLHARFGIHPNSNYVTRLKLLLHSGAYGAPEGAKH